MSPPAGLVRVAHPPGHRSTGGSETSNATFAWAIARDSRGAAPWWADVQQLRSRFPSDHARESAFVMIKERMDLAAQGLCEPDWIVQMSCAPDVLEMKFPQWMFKGGEMQTRLYFSEPRELPGHLVALRLRSKRPGPIGVEAQTGHALESSQLLWEFSEQGFPVSPA